MDRADKIFEIYKILMQQRLGAGGPVLAAQAVSMMDDLERAIEYNRKVADRQKSVEEKRAVWDILNLTVRTSNCLRAEDIYTIEDLCTWTERKLLQIPNMGRRSVGEIKEALANMGLSLR